MNVKTTLLAMAFFLVENALCSNVNITKDRHVVIKELEDAKLKHRRNLECLQLDELLKVATLEEEKFMLKKKIYQICER